MSGNFKGSVVVYSILGCPHCMKAKKLLGELNVPYSDVRLDLYPQIKDEVMQKSGMRTVPQVYFNAKLVGGNDELQKLVKDSAAWEEALKDVRENPMPEDGPIIPDPSTAVAEADYFNIQCEPDEYFVLVTQMKTANVVRTHGSFLKSHKNAFSGQDFLAWVQKEKELDKERGIEMGQALLDHKFAKPQKSGSSFQGGTELYVLNEGDDSGALNGGAISECVPKSANQLGELLRKMILKLYSVYLSEDGKAMDYKGMKASAEFKTYTEIARELTRVDIKSASREEKLAFFINIYNALVIHANIERGPPTNIFGRYKFFNNTKYVIGGHPYSLQDIENGVLRANRKGVGQFTLPFGSKDPRLEIALERHEPLIHFGLVCGAKSCPPIKTYTPEKIYDELKLAASSFLENDDGCQIDMNNKSIKLSSIFKWYKIDFGRNDKEVGICTQMG
ncbi:glutaredoxin [Elysia marginata]|uniref:Glutaredoxin n=1 Tax=Elysia marginata TaxID=1093978 RepID=A0AAV4JIJ2_9GAST|nr:glutaredoxin [Elysia marginata]